MGESNQRQFDRAGMEVWMQFRTFGTLSEIWHLGTILDLSAGGLRFDTEELLEDETQLEFQVYLPVRKNPYQFAGKLLWAKPGQSGHTEYGVEFVRVSDRQRIDMDQLVEFLNRPGPSKS